MESDRSVDERRALGKSYRKIVPRSTHSNWAPAADRPNPIELLQAQDQGRIESLLPIKYGRMLASPFAFLRGSAAVMAYDLVGSPVSGIDVIICGDAHLANFGIFATPERNLVFDINDFDEAYTGPWEWDLKRLAASAFVAGRENGFGTKTCRKLARIVAKSYCQEINKFSRLSVLDVWYHRVHVEALLGVFERASKTSKKSAKKIVTKARSHTTERTLQKMTTIVAGQRQFINNPPLVERITELLTDEQKERVNEVSIEKLWKDYVSSLPKERRVLLSRFQITDVALRVGGVGSVGTRCWVTLIEGDGEQDALILQQKEAGPSVLERYLKKHEYASPAERVVVGQRLMQATPDIFLGWSQSEATDVHYYWRQLKDQKGSFDMRKLDETGMETYLKVCSHCLARAHARTGDSVIISGYLGNGKGFEKAIAEFASVYADQTERDYQTLVDAVNSGEITAVTGI